MKISNIKRIKNPVLLMVAALAFMPGLSHAWWNADWSSRKVITLSLTQEGIKKTVAQAPILVRLHTGNFDFGNAKADGGDIRFVADDDKTPLKYHLEKYDAINEMALAWVQIPQLVEGKAATIYLYSGNEKASAADEVANTYDANVVAVYHFDEKNGMPQDSTANSNHAAKFSAKLDSGELIGGGATFNGTDYMTLAASPSLKAISSQGLTVSTWVKVTAAQSNAILFQQQDAGKSIVLGVEAGKLYASINGLSTQKTTELVSGSWHHVALTAGSALTLYLDGKEIATAATPFPDMQGDITIGKGYAGSLDELEISNVARSAEWILLAAKGQGTDSQLLGYGQDEAPGSEGGNSYFGTILHSVTLDGWVVIGILMVMAVISWLVMALKSLVINKAEKANKAFLHDYKELAIADTGKLDANDTNEDDDISDSPLLTAMMGKHDHFQDSPLYQIYHTGVQEIKRRFGNAEVGKQSLTPQAIVAIRASMDATLVRENQKLNSLMVLLTIAISGGPFLGLLGTVVGVMITFAAIAATGDVNVAAIAPGIAAALVATVAGLAVAIPALFGYNYIGSKVKNVSADMHVFSDEFVGRITEAYTR